jgi:SPP1 family predicted phage head-tail adaptor
MRAGPMRQRVTIENLIETADGYGQMIQSWTSAGTFWAKIQHLTGREAVNARQVKAETTHMVQLRYIGKLWPTGEIPPSSRMSFKGRYFNILWVPNVDERNREYRILVQELVKP